MSFGEQLSEPHHADPVCLPGLFNVVRCDDDRRPRRRAAADAVAAVRRQVQEVAPDGRPEKGVDADLDRNNSQVLDFCHRKEVFLDKILCSPIDGAMISHKWFSW